MTHGYRKAWRSLEHVAGSARQPQWLSGCGCTMLVQDANEARVRWNVRDGEEGRAFVFIVAPLLRVGQFCAWCSPPKAPLWDLSFFASHTRLESLERI